VATREQFVQFAQMNKRRAQAWGAAEALLRAHLTAEQRRELDDYGRFEVRAKWRRPLRRSTWHTFQISPGDICELKRDGKQKHFCIIALEPEVPTADVMLTLKLMVESDLNRFYKTARPLLS
jgi:hypothetical protein